MALMEKELWKIKVFTRNWDDGKKLQNCDAWVVEAIEFNTDTQEHEAILRQFNTMKDM